MVATNTASGDSFHSDKRRLWSLGQFAGFGSEFRLPCLHHMNSFLLRLFTRSSAITTKRLVGTFAIPDSIDLL